MEILQVILYALGSVLLIVLIILGIKMIGTMDKINAVVDNIDSKVKTLDGFFSLIDFTTDKLTLLSDRVVDTITTFVKKIFGKRKGEINEQEK